MVCRFTDHLTVVKELNSAWKGGRFSHWFGGPRAGRYMTCTLEARFEGRNLSPKG